MEIPLYVDNVMNYLSSMDCNFPPDFDIANLPQTQGSEFGWSDDEESNWSNCEAWTTEEDEDWARQLKAYWDEEFGLDVLRVNESLSLLAETVQAVPLGKQMTYAEALKTGLDENSVRVFDLGGRKGEVMDEPIVKDGQYVFFVEQNKRKIKELDSR
jgi:hypothetical protein